LNLLVRASDEGNVAGKWRFDRMPKIRFLPPLEFVKNPALRDRIPLVAGALSSSKGEIYPALLLSGCRDVEFSYDANFDGRANGALTRAAIG
jgi:metacaspase-1